MLWYIDFLYMENCPFGQWCFFFYDIYLNHKSERGPIMNNKFSTGIQEMLDRTRSDEAFKSALGKCQSMDAVISLLSEHNIHVTKEELEAYKNTQSSEELSDEALDNVTGAWCISFEIDL